MYEKQGDTRKCVVSQKHLCYTPVFDSVLMRKVSQSAPVVDCETFVNFTNARYTIYFLVCEQIFLILAIGTICFDVQNPNASCRASVISVLV